MLLPNIRITFCALLLPLFCVLALLASPGAGVPPVVQQQENVFIDAEQLRAFIVGEIAKDLTANGNQKLTLTEKVREVRIGLLASLFPESTEEKGQEVQQLRNNINGIFANGLFDIALPDMILNRIDQLALRPHMEALELQRQQPNFQHRANSSSDPYAHSLPDESDPRTLRQNVQLYRAAKAANSQDSSRLLNDLTAAELRRKVGIQLRVHYGEMELEDKQKHLEKFVVNSSARNSTWLWRWNNPKLLYNFFKGVAYKLHEISSDSRFAQLKIVTKVRLFFHHWLHNLIFHLDMYGYRRAKLYHADPTALKCVPGQAFELYLVEWLQNNVLNPLGQRIIRDLFDHQGSWEPLLPFCVHMSLRPFFNYAERLELDEQFVLERLILSGPFDIMVMNFLKNVIEKLSREGKTAKELVKPIRDEIFANLPLPDDAPMKLRLDVDVALFSAANDMGKAAINIAGDPKVLLQFFIAFYRELNKLASPEWLQTLLNTLTQELKAKEEMEKLPTDDLMDLGQEGSSASMSPSSPNSKKHKNVEGDEHALAVISQEQQEHHDEEDGDKKMKLVAEEGGQHDHEQEQRQQLRQRKRKLGKEPGY